MKVRATKPGFYHGRRRIGDTFEVPDKLFSKTWMQRVEAAPKAGPPAAEQSKAGPPKP